MEHLLLLLLLVPIQVILTRWIFGIGWIVANLEKIQSSIEEIIKENKSTQIKYDRIIKQQETIINLNAERNNRQAEMIDLLEETKL
ncbi:hypothetical protein [Dapis sp. BLCC M229]|uniref:hypothetical protein n=1 Tax=Dapis sp. BLCC M229 TaxID=3400188 RepID=UPI003CFA8B96